MISLLTLLKSQTLLQVLHFFHIFKKRLVLSVPLIFSHLVEPRNWNKELAGDRLDGRGHTGGAVQPEDLLPALFKVLEHGSKAFSSCVVDLSHVAAVYNHWEQGVLALSFLVDAGSYVRHCREDDSLRTKQNWLCLPSILYRYFESNNTDAKCIRNYRFDMKPVWVRCSGNCFPVQA